ncbi:MAG: HD domain-containing protein [Nanoarchaeota archaeon]
MKKKRVSLTDFCRASDVFWKRMIRLCFSGEKWVEPFMVDTHHGFAHANEVRRQSLALIGKLTRAEAAALLREGKQIGKESPLQCATAAIEIAAMLHDCGRFNAEGKILVPEQKNHHTRSAKRADFFCIQRGFPEVIPLVRDAILSHDFQSRRFTPDFAPPKKMIGKIVQSADQMCWFHPDSVFRTIEYNKLLHTPFFDPSISMKIRKRYIPSNHGPDAVTVMLCQLFGPCGKGRFGIHAAQKQVRQYKASLKRNILKVAQSRRVRKEVKTLLSEFEKRKNTQIS